MIGHLNGKIISIKPTQILLDVNGVGYRVNISINTFEKISDQEKVSLYIFTSVKEDSISLFGFFTESEKEMFELLISISGIGPKLALSILSGITIENLKDAIQSANVGRITSIPGVGKKTAERLILELKSKTDSITVEGGSVTASSITSEAIAALLTLGYNVKTAEKVVRDVLDEKPDSSIEELIKNALAKLNG